MSNRDHRNAPTTASGSGHGPDAEREGAGHAAPGKRTLVQLAETAPSGAPAAEPKAAGATRPGVHGAAARGTSGRPESLPFADTIQRAFGRHDISGVQAHTDASATAGARAMGAQAFATGNHIAFGSTPDLHTAAHEAAHVVQQRGGLQLKGGVGESGDPHEQHANQVADRVVAGTSAEDLLDRYTSSGGPVSAPHEAGADAGSSASVQRQSTGNPPGPQGAQPTPNPAPDSTAAPSDPPSRHATWDQISGAAEDPKGQEDLDIAWIESLPDHLRESIDVAFADNTASEQVAKSAAPGLAKIDAEINAAEKQLAKDTKKRLLEEHKRATDKDAANDPAYLTERDRLEKDRAKRKEEYRQETRDTHDAAVKMDQPKQSVARPGTATVKRLEGKALARTNFMSWAVDIFGNPEAVKAHFKGIKPVKGHPNMWLAAAARARFEAAQTDFETRHSGYTIVDTSVANDLRGMHQQRWGIGMLGHPLGEAIDLKAIDNPNIKIDDSGHNYGYLIGKFGGEHGKRGTGRAKMSISEAAVEKTGEETVAGKNTPEGAALIASVQQQFAEMAQTSERLKASMAAEMPRLQAARDLYFEQAGLRVELSKAKADLAHADAVANKRLAGQKFDTPDAKKAAIEQIKSDLAAAVKDKTAALASSEADVRQALLEAFAGWTAGIQADVDTDQALLDQNQASRTAMTGDEQALAAIDASGDDAKARLNQFAVEHNLTPLDKMKRAPKDAKAYKQALASELKGRDTKGTKALASRDADAHTDIKELQFYQKKLMDPAFVFGRGEKQDDGHWASKYDVSQVPLMQLLEHGTVRDDPMPEREAAGPRKGVYNAEVVATLAKFGWAPGANFGDTMHFDFIEGYSKAVPGGRSAQNMKRTRYSPEGDLPPPTATSPHKDEPKK